MENVINKRHRFNTRKFGLGVLRWSLTLIICFIILLPLYWIFLSSITSRTELYQLPIHYIPNAWSFDNYRQVYVDMKIPEKVFNTGVITFFSLIVSILISTMAAYAFARFKAKSLTITSLALLFSTMIPTMVTARATYDLMRSANLIDTFPGLILLYTSGLLPFSVMVLQSFLKQIPYSIEEAAEVDGANFLTKIFQIIFPLMSPAIATIAIINFINCLDNLFTPLLFSTRIEVLSVCITNVPKENVFDEPWDLIATIGCMILLPIVIFVFIFEKRIMEGIMAGGVKQ